MIIFGAAFMAISAKSIDLDSRPFWMPGLAWVAFLIAFILICQGTVLILDGVWLSQIF
jgi:hypothetical protein